MLSHIRRQFFFLFEGIKFESPVCGYFYDHNRWLQLLSLGSIGWDRNAKSPALVTLAKDKIMKAKLGLQTSRVWFFFPFWRNKVWVTSNISVGRFIKELFFSSIVVSFGISIYAHPILKIVLHFRYVNIVRHWYN